MVMMEKLSKRVRNIRSTNSLLDFCYVAEGKLGAALNQTTKIWDIAAPFLLITEAGGTVTTIEGEPIQFDLSQDAIQLNYTIAATVPDLHKPLMDTIQSPAANRGST